MSEGLILNYNQPLIIDYIIFLFYQLYIQILFYTIPTLGGLQR